MLDGMSDPVKLALIGLVSSGFTLIGGIVSAWIGYKVIEQKVANAIPEIVAPLASAVAGVEDVKTVLTDSVARAEQRGITLDAILRLVNGGTAAMLLKGVASARKRFTEHDSVETRSLLEDAERLLREHLARPA